MDASLPVLCGMASTVMFVVGTLPMLVKAARTRDLASYSLGNIVLSNIGNAVNTVYVLSLPPGPIWFLHAFYVVTTALMLFWYVRYVTVPRSRTTRHPVLMRPSGTELLRPVGDEQSRPVDHQAPVEWEDLRALELEVAGVRPG